MSRVKVKQPVIHTPAFTEYKLTGPELHRRILKLGLAIPFGMLDHYYYYTDLEGWGKVLADLAFKSSLYKEDKFDCENYALKAMSLCHERYSLNTFFMVIGTTPLGRHSFNMFFYGDGFMLFEPNAGFGYGSMFELGDNKYDPVEALI